MVSTDVIVPKTELPVGEYKIVAWDLDVTGRRLIDEFCHIAGYTPEDNFSQYVMPYKDLDLISKRRHLVRTVTVGKFRMLKDLKTGKFLKTKSEISALIDFLTWLEKIKGDNNPGIILLNYETFKLVPFLLLEALSKYQLLDRFKEVVKGFSDCHAYVKQKCDTTLTSFSLKVVSKVLLDKNGELSTASDRSRLAYEIVQHLTAGEGDSVSQVMLKAVQEHSSTVEEELQVIEKMKVMLQRQNTLKPVFAPIMSQGIPQRKFASALRRLLTVALLDYNTLKAFWDEDKDNFEATIYSKLDEASEVEKRDIFVILTDHFSSNVAQRSRNSGKVARRFAKESREQATSSDIASTTDTTASNTTTSSPSKSNGLNTPQMEESPKHEPSEVVKSKQEPPVPNSSMIKSPKQVSVVSTPQVMKPLKQEPSAPSPKLVKASKQEPSVPTLQEVKSKKEPPAPIVQKAPSSIRTPSTTKTGK